MGGAARHNCTKVIHPQQSVSKGTALFSFFFFVLIGFNSYFFHDEHF